MPGFDRGVDLVEVGEGKGATGAVLRPAHSAAGSSSFVQDAPDSAVWWMHHISVCDFLHGKMRAKSNCSYIPWGGPKLGLRLQMCSRLPITVPSQMAEHHVSEAVGHISTFFGNVSGAVSGSFFILSSSDISLVALSSAARSYVGRYRWIGLCQEPDRALLHQITSTKTPTYSKLARSTVSLVRKKPMVVGRFLESFASP